MFFGQPYCFAQSFRVFVVFMGWFLGFVVSFLHSEFELSPFESAILRLCIIKSCFHYLLHFFFLSYLFS